jgi:O-antigen/teichoic acid export membrane protein
MAIQAAPSLQGKQLFSPECVCSVMLRSLWKPLSANGLQLLLNQVLSLCLFVLLARHLDKEAFGRLNGMLATLLLAFGVLSFGIDQLLVRKVASGEDPSPWLGTMLLHNVISGLIFLLLLLFTPLFMPGNLATCLLLLAMGKWALFLGTAFKSVVTGQERFRPLLFMSVTSNIVKTGGLWLLLRQHTIDLPRIALLFALADGLEAVCCFLVYRHRHTKPVFRGSRTRYRALLLEARPQLGTVIFAAALARFDWLYLGASCPAKELAEYSFAYKAFEIAQLPLLVIAPVLVPRFTRLLQTGSGETFLRRLLRTELLLAAVSVLALNAAWTPLAGWISGGKYGAVNRGTIALLSLALPILYYNNFLWSLHFASGRTGLIFRLFALTFLVNAAANWLLVPLWQKEGAAASFLLALLVQTAAYHLYADPAWRLRTRRVLPQATHLP